MRSAGVLLLVWLAPLAGRAADEAPAAPPAGEPAAAEAAAVSRGPSRGAAATDAAEAFLYELREYQKQLELFDAEITYHVTREVDEKKAAVNRSYDQVTSQLEKKENDKRLTAIARHKDFLKRHPEDRTYTPDVLFRLAELLYEKAQVDYNTAEEDFDKQYDLYRRGKVARPPTAPLLSLAEPIVLYEDLIKRFPTYRYIDSAHYLLGYCYLNMDKYDEAIAVYSDLVEKFPKSRHIDEGWMRLGELYFDIGEWSRAIPAYQHVLEFPQSKWYELAFYKLAWSYFQNDQYDAAILKFLDLLDFYAQKTGAVIGDDRAQMLRSEVIEYIAKTLAEDDWDKDGLRDPNAGPGRGLSYLSKPRPPNREILQKYADTLYELHERPKYFEAIEVYKAYLALESNGADDPEVQERIVAIYDILGDVEGGIRERGRMTELYGAGSAWYQANATNAKAISKADELVEKYAQERALALHQNAQKTKLEAQAEGNPARLALADQMYREAAAAYQDYLLRYPNSPTGYELTFYLAETLYYSKQHLAAADTYEKVRDFPGKTEYLEYAANSAIVSLQDHIQLQIDTGKLPKWALSKEIEEVEEVEGSAKEKKGGVKRVQPRAIPEILTRYVATIDEYVKRDLERKDDPEYQGKMAYKAAEVFLRFRHYDEARTRFEGIVERYPSQLVANYAAANIINTYWEENDIENVKRWARLIEEKNIGRPEERKKWQTEIRVFEMGAAFTHAMKLLEEKQHVAAAEEFISLVNANPDFEDADKALLNAALALQDAHRYEQSARVIARIVTEPRYQKSQYLKPALFNLAENYQRFFNFDKAIWGYRTLYEKYPTAEEAKYSLYQAAELLEYNQQYEPAIELFERYARDFPKAEETGAIAWRVVTITEKMGVEGRLVAAWERFVKTQYASPRAGGHVLEAMLNLANHHRVRGDDRAARALYNKIVSEYTARAFEPGKLEASYAAEATFRLLEYTFEEYRAVQIVGSLEQQGKAIQKKRKMLVELEKAYADIFPFKSVDWTVAAFFRMGHVWQLLAKAVFEAPIPEALSEEEQDIYRMQLEDIALKWENTAIERYETTIKNARAMNVMNEWTKKTLEALNAYKPAEYPLFKEEKRFFAKDLVP